MNTQTSNELDYIRVSLQREFLDRCRKNPAYSLRAFAKYLEIDQSFLSKLLKGQRAVTPDFAQNVGPKLGLKPAQIKSLFKTGVASLPGFLPLSDDEFEMLSEWHHFAILELIKTDDFETEPAKISTRLGIHVEEVKSALDRLQRLNFIRVSEKGVKLLSANNTWTNTKQTSVARKNLQKKILEKSIDALEHVPFELREHSSLTVAINVKKMPAFKEKMKEIRKELADFLQADGEENLNEVYQLTLSLFPLTQIKNKE